MRRLFLALALLTSVTACTDATRDLAERPDPLGDFALGFVAAAAPAPQKLLVSRDATPEEWIAVMEDAFLKRFGRFDGTRTYNIGLKVEAYSLPPPIVPGKSAVQVLVTVWDDASASKLNDEVEPIAVIRLFESRLASSREESMKALAAEAALLTENWLRRQQAEQGWFGGPAAAPVAGASGAEAGTGAGDVN